MNREEIKLENSIQNTYEELQLSGIKAVNQLRLPCVNG